MNPFNLFTRGFLFEEAGDPPAGGGNEDPEVVVETDDEPGETDSVEEPADDFTEEQAKEAKHLYKLLSDPSTQKDVLRVLAGKAGLFQADTPKEEVKATKKVADILKAKLGDKFDFLTPMLAEALEEILQGEREVNSSQINSVQQTQLNNDVQSAFNKLSAETKGTSRNLESKMAALSQKFPPGSDISVEEYVRGLYAMANSGASKGNNAQKVAERINRNSKDVPSRLQSRATGAGKDSPRNLGKLNLNQAIAEGMKALGIKSD